MEYIGDYHRDYEGGCQEFRLWLITSVMRAESPCSVSIVLAVHGAQMRKTMPHMGGCQNSGPSLDPYHSTAPNI